MGIIVRWFRYGIAVKSILYIENFILKSLLKREVALEDIKCFISWYKFYYENCLNIYGKRTLLVPQYCKSTTYILFKKSFNKHISYMAAYFSNMQFIIATFLEIIPLPSFE